MNARKREIARRFGAAASGYDRAAAVQRLAADRLAQRILAAGLPRAPRILEIGCGTGLLSRGLAAGLPGARWVLTDLSETMLRRCRGQFSAEPRPLLAVMDAEAPSLRPGFDLVCGGLALQWFEHRRSALRGLAGLLHPGGLLALSTLCEGSFAAWRAALRDEGAADAMPDHPSPDALQADWPEGGAGSWQLETLLERHPSGLGFLRGLRAIGADLPRPGAAALGPATLRRVLRRFDAEHGGLAEYRIGYGLFRRAGAAPATGVFVTGTDTGVGKTLVSACLVQAWGARYWKPLQTGMRDEPGDTDTVTRLASPPSDRALRPRYALQAPLSPAEAARLEGVAVEPREIVLPEPAARPLVVEGAGGLMVPIATAAGDPEPMMIDLVQRLALPVVLVARGTLGTINHTLLSLEALRSRGIIVAGVILNGACTDANRDAIARHGRVRILAVLPQLDQLDAEAVRRLARLIPSFAETTGWAGKGFALDPLGPTAPVD